MQDDETSVEGFSYRLRDDGIHEFHFSQLTDAVVDAWLKMASQVDEAPYGSARFYSLYRINNLWPTPYAVRAFTTYLRHVRSDIEFTTAVVMGDSSAALLVIQAILRQMPGRFSARHRLFFNSDEAIAWLHERQREDTL